MTNLIVIDCHDLGQHLSCYGQSTVSSDALDSLAKRGIQFENSFCTAPQCSPSRATLYTGRYSHSNGMMGLAHKPFSWRMHSDETYLAQYLQDAGYETVHVGVQHVTSGNESSVRALGFDRILPNGDLAPDVATSAIAYLKESHQRPFFLNIGFFEPHRDHNGEYKIAPPDESKGVELPSYIPQIPEAQQEFTELQGMIQQMDKSVALVIETLESSNLMDDTWLIFTTDHGLAMPRAKCTMYDPGIETALIMHAPSLGLVGGKRLSQMVSHVDLVPTILDGLDIDIPDHLQGRSYWSLLQGTADAHRDAVYASKTFHTDYEPQRMIRTTTHKLIWNAEVDIINVPADIMHSPIYPHMIDVLTVERPPFELYDLVNDPREMHNLADDVAHTAILDTLRERLFAWMRDTNDPILEGPIASPYYYRAMQQLKGH